MRVVFRMIVFIIVFANFFSCNEEKESAFTFISREDNDFVSYYDSVGATAQLPKSVEMAIETIINDFYAKNESLLTGYFSPKDLRGQVFSIALNDDTALFVFKLNRTTLSEKYCYFIYSKRQDIISKKPITINGAFMSEADNPTQRVRLAHPLTVFADFDCDGVKELCIKEFVHNGTAYNAIIERWYRIGEGMELECLTVLEREAAIPWTDSCTIRRVKKCDTIFVSKYCGDSDVEMGRAIFKNGKILSKSILASDFDSNILLTSSGIPDSLFCMSGYNSPY